MNPEPGVLYRYHCAPSDFTMYHYFVISRSIVWDMTDQFNRIKNGKQVLKFTPWIDIGTADDDNVIDCDDIMLCVGPGIRMENETFLQYRVTMYPMLVKGILAWLPSIFSGRLYRIDDPPKVI